MTPPSEEAAGRRNGLSTDTFLQSGRNCWRIGRARKACLIIDAEEYYRAVRSAMLRTRERILVCGWDFDTRIRLDPQREGRRKNLASLFLKLVAVSTELHVCILQWSLGAHKQIFSLASLINLWRWRRANRITLKLDAAHPAGCSHHQKIVTLDRSLAVCGGIDIAAGRWDTTDHLDNHPTRIDHAGNPYGPWHDVTMMLEGPIAGHLDDLALSRWKAATGETLPPAIGDGTDLWPEQLAPQFEAVDVAIARTSAAYGEVEAVNEIEQCWLDMIAHTRRHLYIENQYFTCAKIAGAIAARLQEPEPPEFILVMPRTADGWLEQKAMDGARIVLARQLAKSDPGGRFHVLVPVTQGGSDIYVHSKLAIMDDSVIRVGSANLNSRSMALDSECDVIIDCNLAQNARCAPQVLLLRQRLLAEHLGVTLETLIECEEETGSLWETIQQLQTDGRSLRKLELVEPGVLDSFIAENKLLDPAAPDQFFEPFARMTLHGEWRQGKRRLTKRLWARLGAKLGRIK